MKHGEKNKLIHKKWILALLIILMLAIMIVIFIGAFSVKYVIRPWNSTVNYLKGDIVSIESFDEIYLTANKRYAEENLHKWAVIVHSYRSHKSAMSAYEKWYHENGYNTLTVDNRAHGASGGNYIGMGYLDKFDISSWVEYILDEDPSAEIVLHGLSMGAAAVMMYSGEDNVPENVLAAVEDSGYRSAESYLRWKLKERFRIPSFPIIPIANIAFKVSAGYYMKDASAIEAVKSSKVPILFIHGDRDMTVPVEDVYALYEAVDSESDIYIVEGAGHGEAINVAKDKYWNRVEEFINKVKQG